MKCSGFLLRDEGVFVVFYLRSAGLAQNYRNNIEAKGTILDIVTCEEITRGSLQFCFFSRGDGRLDFGEFFIRSRFDLDKDDTAVGIDHNQVYFAGFTGKITSENLEAFAFEKFLAAFLAPSAEQFSVGQKLASVD